MGEIDIKTFLWRKQTMTRATPKKILVKQKSNIKMFYLFFFTWYENGKIEKKNLDFWYTFY